MARLAAAKGVLHAAAVLTKRRAAAVGAETVPEKLHWTLMAFRSLRAGTAGRFYLRKAAAAFPELAHWLPGGNSAGDYHKLGDMVADLTARSLSTDILESIADEGPPSSKGRTKLSKLHCSRSFTPSRRRGGPSGGESSLLR